MTTIAEVDNWGYWRRQYQMEGAGDVKILFKMLEEWALDVTFEAYGDFVTFNGQIRQSPH